MKITSKIEQQIYNCAGGGENGEKAVMERRKYLEEHRRFLSEEYRLIREMKYMPRNEKTTATLPMIEDDYD